MRHSTGSKLFVPALFVLFVLALPAVSAAGALENALDNPFDANSVTPLEFTTDGALWSADTTTTYTNGSSARSGGLHQANVVSSLTTTVKGPASISFYQKVSSQPTYDGLSFFIDNLAKYKATAEVNWQQKVFTLPSGTHTLQWKYRKDATIDRGSDAAWLDKVVVSPNTSVRVVLPNGGEKLISGTTATITWNAPAGAEKYDLYYTTNNGATWPGIVSGFTSTLLTSVTYTAWSWPVQKANLTACKVKVVAKNSAGAVIGSDVSDKLFSVNNVTLVAPNGKEVIEAGSTFAITWNAAATASSFALSYSWDNGLSWKPITSSPISGVTGTSWNVPVPPANKTACKVKIIAYNSLHVAIGTDVSDAVFTMQVLKVTSPNGGEILNPRATPTFPISFTVSGQTAASATISFTMNNGQTWPVIASLPGIFSEGTYTYNSWSVPAVTAQKTACKVKVVLKNNAGTVLATDTSDVNFTIKPVFTLSGTVTRNGKALSGATISLTGTETASVTTDYYGKYFFIKMLPGSYTITPTYPGYAFTPPSVTRTVTTTNIGGINFNSGLSSDTIPPSVPSALLVRFAGPSSTTANLSWAASTDNIGVTGYKIYRNGVYLKSLSSFWGTATTDVVPLLGGTYCYAITAYDAAGNQSAKCAEVCGDRVPPSAPTMLSAVAVYPTQVDLLWTAPTDTGSGVAGYNLYRDDVQVKSSITGTGGSNGGLAQGTSYCFTVTAFDHGSNESLKSAPVCTTTPTWQYEFVTKTTNTESVQSMNNGDYSAIAFDDAGHLHAVYKNDNNWPYETLQYATNALGSWASTTLVPFVTGSGILSAIATGPSGSVHVIYDPTYTSVLYHMTNSLGSWVTTTIQNGVDGSQIRCNAVAVDKDNKVHISYCNESNTELRYATNASGAWVTAVLDTDTEWYGIRNTSIALDSQGKAYITYVCGTFNYSDSLKLATNATGTWVSGVIDEDAGADMVSIGIDSKDYVHIAYHRGGAFSGALRYATDASGEWTVTTVDYLNNLDIGGDPALKVDKNDKVHIVYQEADSYHSTTYSTLKHATNASGEWNAVYILAPSGSVNMGYSNSIDINPLNNTVHLSTYDAHELGMKHWYY